MYRALLHLYPKSFRGEYEGEMCAVFSQRLRDASGFELIALWIETLIDVLLNAACVHLRYSGAGPALFRAHAAAIAGLRADRGGDRRPGDRRDHRRLFDYRSRAPAPPAVSRRRPPGDGVGEGVALLANGIVAGELSRLEGAEQVIRGVRRVHNRFGESSR